MLSKLEILSQVLLSLKTDQSNVMNNINALLNNRDTEVNLIEKIKNELGFLSSVHSKMQECEYFMLQLAQATAKEVAKETIEDNRIGSDGDAEKDEHSGK